MRLLRSTWGSRLAAGLLAVSLLPAVLVLPRLEAASAGPAARADWLRAQVRGEADRAFEQALEAAVAARAYTLRDFLAAFVEGHPAPERLGSAFARAELSDEALVRYLQQRYLRLSGFATLSHSVWAAVVSAGPAPDRLPTLATVRRLVQDAALTLASVMGWRAAVEPLVYPLRARFSAQPLGP